MNAVKLEELACVAKSKARLVKLWENIGIYSIGPHVYRKYLVPLYEQINSILAGTGKRLMVHYDGKIRPIADDIARLRFDIDSLTPPPEGDMEAAQARAFCLQLSVAPSLPHGLRSAGGSAHQQDPRDGICRRPPALLLRDQRGSSVKLEDGHTRRIEDARVTVRCNVEDERRKYWTKEVYDA